MVKSNSEYAKEWKLKNPEKYKENIKRYIEKNRDKINKRSSDYYYKNHDKILEKNRLNYLKNKEKKLDAYHKYCKENPNKIRETCRKSYWKHRDKYLEYSRKYKKENNDVIMKYRNSSNYYLKESIRNKTRRMINGIKHLFVCNECGSDVNVQIHHFDYVDGDFTFLCKLCHAKIHRIKEVDKNV